MKTKITLGESVKVKVYSLVSRSVYCPVRSEMDISVSNLVEDSVYSPVRTLTRWRIIL